MRGLNRISVPGILAVLFAAAGFLNIATGALPVLKLSGDLGLGGIPEFLRIAPAQEISGVFSISLGVLMIALGRGLYERRRAAWWWALGLLVILAVNNFLRGTTPQTGVLSGLLIAGLLVIRRQFDVRSKMRVEYGEVVALVSVLFALAYGVTGSYVMREQFSGLDTWTDAVYYTFVTYSTLGYGDILPKTPDARLFVVSMIVVGLGSFLTAVTMVVGPMIERRMKGVLSIMSKLKGATDHVIVCGYSNVGESVVDELQGQGVRYVVVDDREDLAAHLRSKGHDVLTGDATRSETLERANLRGARAVVAAFDSDSVNTLVTITAKACRDAIPGCRVHIVARAEDEENIEKIRRVGADEVISPSTLGGRMIARKAVEPMTEPDAKKEEAAR